MSMFDGHGVGYADPVGVAGVDGFEGSGEHSGVGVLDGDEGLAFLEGEYEVDACGVAEYVVDVAAGGVGGQGYEVHACLQFEVPSGAARLDGELELTVIGVGVAGGVLDRCRRGCVRRG